MSRGTPLLRFVSAVVLIAFGFFLATLLLKRQFAQRAASPEAPPEAASAGALLQDESNTIQVFQQASPAVVFVHNLQDVRNIWSWDVAEIAQGTGSGFLWDKQGHIVTNFHVVQGASRVAVTLIDGNTYRAKVVGFEPRKDLAVLKIELLETNVTPFAEKVADSSQLAAGQKAIAIGNPFGLDHTLTVGAISAIGRSMSSIVEGVTIRDMIQTDAAINPGNSGGPLLDSQGRLIGMNTLILRNSTGIGFAVPSNTIERMVNQIILHGRPVQAGVGMTIFEDRISQAVAARLGVQGVMLREVLPDSPAAKAGLRGTARDPSGNLIIGDIILSVDGDPTRNYDDMYNAFDEKKPGDLIEVQYFRSGETNTVSIPLVAVSD